jgi:hypothetical protein
MVYPVSLSEGRHDPFPNYVHRSMQSERVRVLVGMGKDPFEVPYDLLAQYSRNFKKLRNALNDSGDEIILPDVTKSTFEDFFIWLHAYEPSILPDESPEPERIDSALHLAVFAQKYQIYHLRNQASDVVRVALLDGNWNISPDMISAVYKVAPAGSALRQLSFLGFVAIEGRKDSNVWQAAFIDCPDLGWDYFQYKSGNKKYSEGIESGGACRFHDHSDIRGWSLQDVLECPYPHGAPRQIPGELDGSTSSSAPVVHDIPVQGAINTSQVRKKSATMPSVAEAVEPEPVGTQPAEELVAESSAEQPPESACWASETTETEPVETESGKFEPQEEPLVEETTVKTWISNTEGTEPLEAEGLPAEEEPSQVTVGNARMTMIKDLPVLSKVTLKRVPNVEETQIENKEPVLDEIPAAEKTPVSEVTDPAQDLSMVRTDSLVSAVDPIAAPGKSKKKNKNKNRKMSQGNV